MTAHVRKRTMRRLRAEGHYQNRQCALLQSWVREATSEALDAALSERGGLYWHLTNAAWLTCWKPLCCGGGGKGYSGSEGGQRNSRTYPAWI